jgi:hypothetical protein
MYAVHFGRQGDYTKVFYSPTLEDALVWARVAGEDARIFVEVSEHSSKTDASGAANG